jgi:hypothetical protein
MSLAVRRWVVALALATTSAFLVWNGVFGLHVSRGEKQYLIEGARHRLGERPAPSMSGIMADTVRDGARQATWWAVVVFGLNLAASYAARRR